MAAVLQLHETRNKCDGFIDEDALLKSLKEMSQAESCKFP
jgi:hypothetical protein